MRGAYADLDGKLRPSVWHEEPNFMLIHPDLPDRSWAGWRITGGTKDDIRDTVGRIAQHYGSDPKITNESRLIRLAGFRRWKENPETKAWEPSAAYELEIGQGGPTELWQHAGLKPLPPRAKHDASRLNDDDVISAKRLRDLLAFIDPADRDDSLRVIKAVSEAKVLLPNLEQIGFRGHDAC